MWADRLNVQARMVVQSPLHVGSGETATFHAKTSVDNAPVEYGLVVQDRDGWPVLPGASLKGILRSANAENLDTMLHALFGWVDAKESDEPPKSAAGRLILRAARMNADKLPVGGTYADEPLHVAHPTSTSKVRHGDRGLAIVARTAIHAGSGVADEGRLFHEQVVLPGAEFLLDMTLMLDRFDHTSATDALREILSPLAAENGYPVGGGTSYGRGRVQLLADSVQVTRSSIDPETGNVTTQPDTLELKITPPTQSDPVCRTILELRGDGPFIVIDSERSTQDRSDPQSKDLPQIVPLEDPTSKGPLMPGESLGGVLRRTASWLDQLAGQPVSDPSKPLGQNDPANLPPVERLFGRNGWKGLLRIGNIECAPGCEPKSITSVKLDRFSMGPIDGGLFETRTYLDPVFTVTLEMVDRVQLSTSDDKPPQRALQDSDSKAFKDLIAHLTKHGIEVGHGSAKGFGWFKVKEQTEGNDGC